MIERAIGLSLKVPARTYGELLRRYTYLHPDCQPCHFPVRRSRRHRIDVRPFRIGHYAPPLEVLGLLKPGKVPLLDFSEADACLIKIPQRLGLGPIASICWSGPDQAGRPSIAYVIGYGRHREMRLSSPGFYFPPDCWFVTRTA